MKTKLNLLLGSFIVVAAASAQNNPTTINDKEHITLEKGDAAIAPVNMNVLYTGVINPLQISVNGIDNFDVRVSQGSIVWKGRNVIHLKVDNTGECVVSLVDKAGKVFYSQTFRVKRVPDPEAVISAENMEYKYSNARTPNKITKEKLLKADSVEVIMKNFDSEILWRLTHFKMTIVRKEQDPAEFDSESNKITPQMKSVIETTQKGDKVYIEYIRSRGDDGTTRSLKPISFEIE